MLAKEDRPVDLLNILRAMLVDNFPVPKSCGNPLPESANGGSIVSGWLESHMEGMSAFRGRRRMAEIIAAETSRDIRVRLGCPDGVSGCLETWLSDIRVRVLHGEYQGV